MHAMAKMAIEFELDAKSGPLEAGDFGKNRQGAGDMWQNIQIGCQKWPL